MSARARSLLVLLVVLLVPARIAAQEKPDPGTAKEKSERSSLLEAVGSLAASQLYQAYLNIGFLADGKAEGTYEEKEARQLLGSVLGLLDTLDQQMTKVGKLDLDKEDKAALEEISRLSTLLRRQGEELQAFWKSGDKERGARYERARQQAWEGIRALLQLEPESTKLVELLRAGLKSKEPRVRLESAQGLAKLGPEAKEAVPALVAALKDSSLSVRNAAGLTLSKIGAEAVPALVKILEDREDTARSLAVQVLGLCGAEAKEAVSALTRALEDPKAAVRVNAIVALGKIGPDAREAIPALSKFLRDRNPTTVKLATAALEAIRKE